jgi:hypothetical protein
MAQSTAHKEMPMRSETTKTRTATMMMATFGLSTLLAGAARAQDAPVTPYQVVSQLDLECRRAEGPPLPNVFIRQLNPVLRDRLPDQQIVAGPLQEVCVPVAKNGRIPDPAALELARFVDVACYQATAPAVDVDVKVSQLNPVLANLPDQTVKMVQLQQLCVPVRKNESPMPPAVKRFVSHFDLGCYRLQEPTADANTTLQLTHLNPVIRAFNQPDRVVDIRRARQLCVPVAKNAQPVPPGVSEVVRWADFLKYDTEVLAGAMPVPLWLNHLNPLFQDLPGFPTVLAPSSVRLMVPVAKDVHLPPNGH